MKSKVFLLMTAVTLIMVCINCTELSNVAEVADVATAQVENWSDSVAHYRALARQGDGQAYRALAQCYHDGHGVEHDYLSMLVMLSMASQYGVTNHLDEFFALMAPDDPDRLLTEGISAIESSQYEDALEKAAILEKQSATYALFLKGIIALEQGRNDEALCILNRAAEEGCILAQIVIASIAEGTRGLYVFCDQMPMLFCEMARDSYLEDDDPEEFQRAARYYRMADERLCLDSKGVRWLLAYYEHCAKVGQPAASDGEIQRLRIMASRLAERD